MTVEVNSVGSIKEEISAWSAIVVLWRLLAKVNVLTKFAAEERYPAVPRPLTVDMSCAEEIYPKVPRPNVVDVRLVDVTSPDPPVRLDI
jgi:hypothetical protein